MTQSSERSLDIDAPRERVWEGLTRPRLIVSGEQTLLEARSLRGVPGAAGHVVLWRWVAGDFDLHIEETVMAVNAPGWIHSSFLPVAMTVYDPAERLPASFPDEFGHNPERAFRRAFGADPQPWEVRFTLEEIDLGTRLTGTARLPEPRRGLFGTKRRAQPPTMTALEMLRDWAEGRQVQ